MSTQPAEFELSISRVIDAPRSRVFRAWTEPALLQQWWGPHGMTTPECEMNLWVGGLFRRPTKPWAFMTAGARAWIDWSPW